MTGRQYSDGEYIYRAGDPADGVYRVRTGQVTIKRSGATTVLGPGEYFGEAGFLTGDNRTADVIADSAVTVDFLRRSEFLAILSLNPSLVGPLISGVFALVDKTIQDEPAAAPPEQVSEDSAESASAAESAAPDSTITMIPDGKRLRAIVGSDEIRIERPPFRIGRSPSGEGKDTYFDINLALDDKRPFNLSRRHFSIEMIDGSLIVRDCGSYHGTTLNGTILGGQDRPQTAPLMTGESELVAGKPDSPFRFRIIVE